MTRFVERPHNELEYESIPVGKLTMEDYLHGWCEYFALALHEEFGYPMYKMRDSNEEENGEYGKYGAIHMFCMNGDSYMDVRGTTNDFTKFFEPYEDEGLIEAIVVSPYEPSPWLRRPEEFGPELIQNAKQYIQEHREFFQPHLKTMDEPDR